MAPQLSDDMLSIRTIRCIGQTGQSMVIPKNDSFESLCRSIQKHGLLLPVYVTKDRKVIVGHYRFLACQKLGHKEIPVCYAMDLKDALAKMGD